MRTKRSWVAAMFAVSGCIVADGNAQTVVTVPATANIYGAGKSAPPNPGGGGPGTAPTVIQFSPSAGGTMTINSVTGLVDCCFGPASAGADGASGSGTSISGYQGISGIVHTSVHLFLVGVFLDDSVPADPAPPTLSFSGSDGGFTELSPALRQTFFIGDGLTGTGTGAQQTYHVPVGATRLYLGFADGLAFQGLPGYYHDNVGDLVVDLHLQNSTWVPQQKLLGSMIGHDEHFSISVAAYQGIVVVGAPQNGFGTVAGSAHVFHRQGSSWVQQATLPVTPKTAGDEFGWHVAIDGTTIVVGAPQTLNATGAVYLYDMTMSGWQETTSLPDPNPNVGARFGHHVAILGDVCVVGAPGGGSVEGRAEVYVRDASGVWSHRETLHSSAALSSGKFGNRVEVTDDYIAVGAIFDNGASSASGATYVFWHDGKTTASVTDDSWLTAPALKLVGTGGAASDEFGFSIAAQDEWLAIGAHQHDTNGLVNAGAIYVFRRDTKGTSSALDDTFAQVGVPLTADVPAADDHFGVRVAIEGDVLVVGAHQKDTVFVDSGSAYVFRLVDGAWIRVARLLPCDPAAGDRFGAGVEVSGGTLFIGASDADDSANDGGALYVFEPRDDCGASWANYGSGCSASAVPTITLDGPPVLGGQVTLQIGSVYATPTTPSMGFIAAGANKASIPSFNCLALVNPIVLVSTSIFAGGSNIPFPIPCKPTLCGVHFYVQAAEADPNASRTLAFTPGLDITLGF